MRFSGVDLEQNTFSADVAYSQVGPCCVHFSCALLLLFRASSSLLMGKAMVRACLASTRSGRASTRVVW